MALRPRINIYDTDYTTISGSAGDALDIAFVPGFTNKFLSAQAVPMNPSPSGSSYVSTETVVALNLKAIWYDTSERTKWNLVSVASAYEYAAQWTAYKDTRPSYTATYASDLVLGSLTIPSGTYTVLSESCYLQNMSLLPSSITSLQSVPVTDLASAFATAIHVDSVNKTISGHLTYYYYNSLAATPYYDAVTFQLPAADSMSYARMYNFSGDASVPATDVYNPTSSATRENTRLWALQYQLSNSKCAIYECTSAYHRATGWHYEESSDDYDYIVGDIVRFNTIADFKAAAGNEPFAVWKYIITDTTDPTQKTTRYSALPLYDFAAKNASTSSPVDVAKYIRERLIGDDAISIVWVDQNWIYAAELLAQGLPVYYGVIGEPFTVSSTYTDVPDFDDLARNKFKTVFESMYAKLADKGEYNIKYLTTGVFGLDINGDETVSVNGGSKITSGAQFLYPFYEIGSENIERSYIGYLADIANYRKDAVVLADALRQDDSLPLDPDATKKVSGQDVPNSVYGKFKAVVDSRDLVNTWSGEIYTADEQAKMGRRLSNTFPWYKATVHTVPAFWSGYRTDKAKYIMPGSFAYLISLAVSVQKYESASWEAIAGVTRALVPDLVSLDTAYRVSNAVADAYNKRNEVGINAISNIRPYGYCIWGNRTLVDNAYFAKQGDGTDGLIASSFVDIISMVCNVNKIAYRTCKRLMFEKDNDVLWTRFRQGVEPYLDQLLTAGALRTYTVEKLEPTMRGQLVAKITLWCTYSVENFDIEIALRDVEATVEA